MPCSTFLRYMIIYTFYVPWEEVSNEVFHRARTTSIINSIRKIVYFHITTFPNRLVVFFIYVLKAAMLLFYLRLGLLFGHFELDHEAWLNFWKLLISKALNGFHLIVDQFWWESLALFCLFLHHTNGEIIIRNMIIIKSFPSQHPKVRGVIKATTGN